jgi:probable HAF family extracellular repeat protein
MAKASIVAVPGFNYVRGVSDNGVATGDHFRWDPVNGHTDLGYLPGPGTVNRADAWGISADGSVIIGTSFSEDGLTSQSRAFVWTSSSGIQPLPSLSVRDSSAFGISSNGRVVAGSVTTTNSTHHAVLWTDGVETLRLQAGTNANSLSRNGLWIGGTEDSFWGQNAFIWSQNTGFEQIVISGPSQSFQLSVLAVTDDGNVAVGSYSMLSGPRPFRWSRSGGFQPLGGTGWTFGVNADGSIMVGSLNNLAFFWTEKEGMRLLQDVLEDDYSFDLTGWSLDGAAGISADGKTIFGYGEYNGQHMNFIATVPEPSSALLFVLGVAVQLGHIRRRNPSA